MQILHNPKFMNTNQEKSKGEIVIYKASEGPEVSVRFDGETAWLSLKQIVDLFGRDKSVISRHIKNVIETAELSEKSVVANFATTAADGKTYQVDYYNLDMIISVGYRVNSKRGTQFRIWATRQLRDHILKGYTVNQQRLKEGSLAQLKELERTIKFIQAAAESKRLVGYEKELIKIIADYTNTWILLNQFDHNKLAIDEVRKPKSSLSYEDALDSINRFKKRLIAQKQATDLFGCDSQKRLSGILVSIEQTFAGRPLYKSLEEKAAHLLYFVIKDHPFVDGNKRIGSLLFILYLVENQALMNIKGDRTMNDAALTTLAILIAQSKPDQKETMVKLIVNLINKK